jgi:hypothetical protein
MSKNCTVQSADRITFPALGADVRFGTMRYGKVIGYRIMVDLAGEQSVRLIVTGLEDGEHKLWVISAFDVVNYSGPLMTCSLAEVPDRK